MAYTINIIMHPFEDDIYQPAENGKVNFFDNNISLKMCVAMILNKNEEEFETYVDFHRTFYGKYLAGFSFEGYDTLPPLCILQTVRENIAVNVVYYNTTIYDPKLGVFSIVEYQKQNISILSYVQMFLQEVYEETKWKPFIPTEINNEFEKDTELGNLFANLQIMEQCKILNCIYPFSRPSSFKENRKLAQPLTSTKIKQILTNIKSLSSKSTWEELFEFETVGAVEVLKKCGIRKGMTVLDLGCGHGHYTFGASIATGEKGSVIAADTEVNGGVLKYVENRATEFNLKNITCLKTNEKGLSKYINSIDFIILYDVLHGIFNDAKSDEKTTTRLELIDTLASLLKRNGILSLALYSEIEHIKIPVKVKDGEVSYRLKQISHNEAIKPYIELIQASGFTLYNVIENGGVHFDDFHKPEKWRKYGEVKVSSLEKRNIYNFVKKVE